MSPILYPSPIVGPIHSHLGISLEVNVNQTDCKTCTSDSIYCEVIYNTWTAPCRRPTTWNA